MRWTDTAQRIISIAGVAPGRHRLEIQSRVRDGPVSPKVAVAEFQIEPEWWETWWLRSAAVLLGAAAVWGVILWRNRLLLLRNRRLEIRVAERTRELRDQVSAKARVCTFQLRTPLLPCRVGLQCLGEIGAAGTSFQRLTSAGAVARQLPYIPAYRGRRSDPEGG